MVAARFHFARKFMLSPNFTMRLGPELNQRLRAAAEKARRKPADFARLAIEDAVIEVETRVRAAPNEDHSHAA
jgi:predicted DNA-binding protein